MNRYTREIHAKCLVDQLVMDRVHDKETKNHIHAFLGRGINHRTLKGLDPRINPNKPPQNFRDTMEALDKQT